MAEELQEHVEQLRDCYAAVLVRRAERGIGSIRTRVGYMQLRTKYQARLRFLQDPELLSGLAPPQDKHQSETSSCAEATTSTETGIGHDKAPVQAEEQRLRSLVGAYFDVHVKRLMSDICWPMAHCGGRGVSFGPIPEWQELEQDKYFAFMYRAFLWLFPGLPDFEAQLQAERDWQKDIEFDVYGTYGLSYEGFFVSLLDLATSCTDGSGDRCLEFLQLLTKQLHESLQIVRVPTSGSLLVPDDSIATKPAQEEIKWHEIPLDTLMPCSVQQKARYYELKTKLSTGPLVIMLLANSEKMVELQLSTSIKLLMRERESRTSVRRQTLGMRSHFIELEKQLLWTFRDLGSHPSVLLVPSELVSRRTMTLYACIRLLDSYEQQLHAGAREDQLTEHTSRRLSQTPVTRPSASSMPALFTLYTSVQDPVPLLSSTHESICGRIDRNGSRLFVIDHRNQTCDFSIKFKTSLTQNTSAAGGAGAATTLSTAITSSSFRCLPGSPGVEGPTAHSYMFVVKCQENMMEKMTSVYGNSAKTHDARLAPQWFTTLSGSNEVKTVFITKSRHLNSASDIQVTSSTHEKISTSGIYYITVFSIHGIYYDAFWENLSPGLEALVEVGPSNGDATTSGPSEADAITIQAVLEQSSTERDELSSVQSSSESMRSSANLLRRLLLLRKKRQAAEPPPEFVPGANVFSTKTLTIAATLRAKFLRARALERRTRLLRNEDSLRSKVLAKLLRSQEKSGLPRQKTARGIGEFSLGDTEPSVEEGNATKARVEARVNLLTHFFREMAMHQPTFRELNVEECSLDAEGQQQDEILDHFGDLFGSDIALHNLLDQEKWMSAEEKKKRRATLLQERLNLKGSAKETKEQVQFCSEDYEATVGFIERLTLEVEGEQADAGDKSVIDSAFEEMKASWAYSNERTRKSGQVKHERQAALFNDLQAQRREQWMRSKYIQHLAAQEDQCNQAHRLSALKSPLITSKQHLQGQTQVLPWQAVWEVIDQKQPAVLKTSTIADTEAAGNHTQLLSRKACEFSPRRPIERPKTARPTDQVASESAKFACANTRRILSARTGFIRSQFYQPPFVEIESPKAAFSPPSSNISRLPLAFVRTTESKHERDQRDEADADEPGNIMSSDRATACQFVESNAEPEAGTITSQDSHLLACEEQSLGSQNLTAIQTAKRKTRRYSNKSLANKQRTDKVFAHRVKELVSIANIVKDYEHMHDEDAFSCKR